jgi:hypothetical protein
MKILLIILVIDTVINIGAKNYIKNDILNVWKHVLTNTPASIVFSITRIIQVILIVWVLIKFVLMIF